MRIEKGRIINDFIEPNKRQYSIPVYQRNYEWADEQCEKLFNDIIEAHTKDRQHFCGSIVYAPGYVCIQYYVAKTQEILDRMREINRQSAEDGNKTGEAERERGRLFGYPETAIDYYMNEWNPDSESNPNDSNPKYHSYIHSPEHAEEEYEQYEKKLDALFKEYCPQSAAELLGEEK